jgi:hypothetical protein
MTPIMAKPRATVNQALAFVLTQKPARANYVAQYIIELWRLCTKVGYDPTVLLAQAIYETTEDGIPFNSEWWIKDLNPAGIGITDIGPQGNLVSNSGILSARVHVTHMAGYVEGKNPAWMQGSNYDLLNPRWRYLMWSGMAGTVKYVEDLGSGTWASQDRETYSAAIIRLINRIATYG